MWRVVLGSLIFVATLALIMYSPVSADRGCHRGVRRPAHVDLRDRCTNRRHRCIVGQWNIYGFFLGLMLISAIADAAGIFDVLAYQAARWAGGSSLRLYLAVFAVGASSPRSSRMTLRRSS